MYNFFLIQSVVRFIKYFIILFVIKILPSYITSKNKIEKERDKKRYEVPSIQRIHRMKICNI